MSMSASTVLTLERLVAEVKLGQNGGGH